MEEVYEDQLNSINTHYDEIQVCDDCIEDYVKCDLCGHYTNRATYTHLGWICHQECSP